jgi:ribosomal protein S18 acetylase RimI-like enzyme
MDGIVISLAGAEQITALDSALRQLARDLGDPYRADQPTLATAICGAASPYVAMLATRDDRPVAATLATPVFSTRLGGAGLFVSDLWVAEPSRGQGLARRLLAATLREGERRNTGRFLKLTVDHDNPAARAVYGRLGFSASAKETNLFLTGAALETLKEPI